MAAPLLPVKTPEGQAELTHRHLKLGQRQRTLLLLVDGRRTEGEVRRMASQAGVPDGCFDELCGLGLIAMPKPPAPVAAAVPVPAPAPAPVPEPVPQPPIEPEAPYASLPIPLDSGPTPLAASAPTSDPDEMTDSEFERELAAQMAVSAEAGRFDDGERDDEEEDDGENDPPLPAALALEPDAPQVDWRGAVSLIRPNGLMDLDSDADDGFEEARALLVRAVRDASPVVGSFTLIRLRRSRSRADLVVLLDDVEARIVKPPGAASGLRTMRRVRELLELPDPADRQTDS